MQAWVFSFFGSFQPVETAGNPGGLQQRADSKSLQVTAGGVLLMPDINFLDSYFNYNPDRQQDGYIYLAGRHKQEDQQQDRRL